MSLRGPPPPLGTPLGAACARRSRLDEVLAAGMAHMAIEPTSMDSGVDSRGVSSKRQDAARSAREKAAAKAVAKAAAKAAAVKTEDWWKDLLADREFAAKQKKDGATKRREFEWWAKEIKKTDDELYKEWIDNKSAEEDSSEEEEEEEEGAPKPRTKMTWTEKKAYDKKFKHAIIDGWIKKYKNDLSLLNYADPEIAQLVLNGFPIATIRKYVVNVKAVAKRAAANEAAAKE